MYLLRKKNHKTDSKHKENSSLGQKIAKDAKMATAPPFC